MFMLAIAQIGPIPVLGASVVWLYWSGSAVWGTVLLLFTLLTFNDTAEILIDKQAKKY